MVAMHSSAWPGILVGQCMGARLVYFVLNHLVLGSPLGDAKLESGLTESGCRK